MNIKSTDMNNAKTKEEQYQDIFSYPETKFGPMLNQVWHDDPKRMTFVFSRYKFVAKMLAGKDRVLEIGCADGFASKIVAHEVQSLSVSDFDPFFVESIKNQKPDWISEAFELDIANHISPMPFDAVYCLDVFEHIQPAHEDNVLQNIKLSLAEQGVAIIGIPSLESQEYASEISKQGHVNCKSGNDFNQLLSKHFRDVFLFSMNDEVVHTGFYPMAHYLLAICIK